MNILVCGTMNEGKSTLALHLLKTRHAGVIVIDPRGMFSGHIVSNVDELEDAIRARVWSDGQPIVFRPMMNDLEAEFGEVCDFLFPAGDTHHWQAFGLLIDEAGEFQTFASIHPSIRRAVAQHYYKGDDASKHVTIVQTAHRLPEFNGKTKAVMHELYIFRTIIPRDLEVLTEYTGDPKIADIVRTLPLHHCVRYKFARQPEGQPQFEVWDDPQKWYLPIEPQSQPISLPREEPNRRYLGRKYYANA